MVLQSVLTLGFQHYIYPRSATVILESQKSARPTAEHHTRNFANLAVVPAAAVSMHNSIGIPQTRCPSTYPLASPCLHIASSESGDSRSVKTIESSITRDSLVNSLIRRSRFRPPPVLSLNNWSRVMINSSFFIVRNPTPTKSHRPLVMRHWSNTIDRHSTAKLVSWGNEVGQTTALNLSLQAKNSSVKSATLCRSALGRRLCKCAQSLSCKKRLTR